jgi:hypothetical protein
MPQMEIVCKIYSLGNLTYQLPPSGLRKPFGFSSFEVRVLDFIYVKKDLETHCKHHLLMNEHSNHIFSQR